MKLNFFCPLWGSEGMPFDEFCQKAKDAGYDGVEMGLPLDPWKKQAILETLDKSGLLLIGQHYETFTADFDEHVSEYAIRIKNLADSKPLFINSQTGKDYFTFDQNKRLIDIAQGIAEESDVQILHETHRGKFGFAAHIARRYFEEIPDMRICLDISHWCNVAESLLHDQQDAVALAVERTDHIHARVGYQEGPQIPDPQDAEWGDALEFHVKCWEKVVAVKQNQNMESLTITTEFARRPTWLFCHLAISPSPASGMPIFI